MKDVLYIIGLAFVSVFALAMTLTMILSFAINFGMEIQ
jgi:hypothetical protein